MIITDAYASLTIGRREYCGEPVAAQDAEPLLLQGNSVAHARCYYDEAVRYAAMVAANELRRNRGNHRESR